MSFDAEQIYRLLPAVHRLRDANAMGTLANNPTPGALREFIEIIADQISVLQEELDQLYDNHFVETAAPWALPYLGELLGLRALDASGRDDRFAPRAEIANTIAYRRRKGTAAMLEQLARDITGRPAAVVEYWKRIVTTQNVNHLRPANAAWTSVRNARELEMIGSPFEQAARTIEVRRIEPGLGKWNIPNIGLFAWRLRDQTRTRTPLSFSQFVGHYRLHPLGLDCALCARPMTETDIAHLAEPENVPIVLTRRRFAGKQVAGQPQQFHPNEIWYGQDRSIQLWRVRSGNWQPVPLDEIVVCDLHDVFAGNTIVRWGHDNTPLAGAHILLDPIRGRVVLPALEEIFATFSVLFPADLGGGEYARSASFGKSSAARVYVAQKPREQQLPAPLEEKIGAAISNAPNGDVVIEIADSRLYSDPLPLPNLVANDVALELRAQDGRWPTIILNSPWQLSGNAAGRITLNGLFVTGQNVIVAGTLGVLRLIHCTLLPGLAIDASGRADLTLPRPAALQIKVAGMDLELDNCILGPLLLDPGARVRMRNCIIDAGGSDRWAVGSDANGAPGGSWQIENSTIVGRVSMRGLDLASNSIFFGDSVYVERRQEGCVRFCSLPADASVPRQHKCVPRAETDHKGKDLAIDFTPQFESLRFGHPAYCQLSRSCADAIRRGADDESEMGVYHDLLEPRREAHLRARLRDYLRFGLEAGVFYQSLTPAIPQNLTSTP